MLKRMRSYWSTSVEKIVNEWDGIVGVKFVRVHFDKNSYMELEIYNSEIFTKQAPQYRGCVILDRFQIRFVKETMKSYAFNIAFKKNKIFKKLTKTKYVTVDNWLGKDEFIELLQEIQEFVSNTEHYRLADILCGDV